MSQQMKDAVQAYIDLFNAQDAQGIADLYAEDAAVIDPMGCLLYTSPSPRDRG